jgi:hypothetical protein
VHFKQSKRKEAVVGRKTDSGQNRKGISTAERCAVCFKQRKRKEGGSCCCALIVSLASV